VLQAGLVPREGRKQHDREQQRPEHLDRDGTRDAFTSGTSLGLRLGAALILVATAVVAHQHPKE
jgi:hypothetical protein